MKSRRTAETRWSDRTALLAAAVAIPVALAAGVATVIAGDPGTTLGMACIVAPAIVAALATALTTHFGLISPHRERERSSNRRLSNTKRELHDEKQERAVLRELDGAIDVASTEAAAIEVIREAFTKHLSMQPMELHLVDAVDPVLELVLATGDHATKAGLRTSPWDSLAARTNTTLVYDTTDRLDVCPHLQGRLRSPMSAIVIDVDECFMHCGKALRRAGVWKPETWPSRDTVPTGGEMITASQDVGVEAAVVDELLEADYDATLWRVGGDTDY